MNVKYQIFVSSTYEDLKEERDEVIKACLNMNQIPVGMEMFNAADEEQWAVITRTIDQCDYYVVVVAHRYGSTSPDGTSYTEREYDYAVAHGVPVLGFVIDDAARWPNDRIDKDPAAVEALRRFKSKVEQKMVRYWRDKSDLQAQFAMSLPMNININPRRGWVRAPEPGGADIAQALSNLAEENARLRQMLEEMRSASAYRDDVDEAVSLLDREVLNIRDAPLSGDRAFFQIAPTLPHASERDMSTRLIDRFGFDKKPAGSFVRKLRLWGLIEGYRPVQLSQLGQRVYKRLSLRLLSTSTR
jgi:nucleoside 2-deoxyribosyltransferase